MTTLSTTEPAHEPAALAGGRPGPLGGDDWLRAAARRLTARVRHGDLGVLPVVLGLLIIWTIFQSQNDRFLSPQNLTNLALQIAAVGTIAVGLFLVLIIGEIDLSVGIVSGFCGAILAVLNVDRHVDAAPAIVLTLCAGALIGAFHGLVVTRVGLPSFVVTLAGFIGWQGALLFVLGDVGTVNLPPSGITALTSTFFPGPPGWVLATVAVAVYAASQFASRRRRKQASLPARSPLQIGLRSVLLAVALGAAVSVLNSDRGVPLSLLIFTGLVIGVEQVAKGTTYGRHVFAIGGNTEAARRAGIPVNRLRVSAMVFSSTMAAAGGILFASRLLAVSQASGSGDVLLNAIAAVVIGGTSLFGGRGTAYSALLGMLVIGSISNGMDLLSLQSSVKFMITGAVLLIAVTVDALARRASSAR